MNMSKTFSPVMLLCAALGCASSAAPSAASLRVADIAGPDITGRWRSERPEALPATNGYVNYLVRDFTFSGERWAIDYQIYDDESLGTLLLSGHNEGRYAVSSDEDASGQSPAEFAFERRTLTPHSQRFAQALNASGCGNGAWEVGNPQSVLDEGCEAFRIFKKSVCEREYDLVKVQDGRLFLGARPADGSLCSPARRPARLGASLVKVREKKRVAGTDV
jgi:hypothetical protein